MALAVFPGEFLFSTLSKSGLQSKVVKTPTAILSSIFSLLRARAEGENSCDNFYIKAVFASFVKMFDYLGNIEP